MMLTVRNSELATQKGRTSNADANIFDKPTPNAYTFIKAAHADTSLCLEMRTTFVKRYFVSLNRHLVDALSSCRLIQTVVALSSVTPSSMATRSRLLGDE
jgi:hypothetical protein